MKKLAFHQANLLLSSGNYQQAVQMYQLLIDENPDFAPYYYNLANAYQRANSPISAYFVEAQSFINGQIDTLNKSFDTPFNNTDVYMNINITSDTVLVIIPVYNAADTIQECIDSVLTQTYSNVWIIAVDDCSQDNSFSVLKKLQRSRTRLSVLKSRINLGTYNCVNLGMYFARQFDFGYFLIHGADDVMHKNKIATQVKSIQSKIGAKASIAGYNRVDIQTKKIVKTSNKGHSMAIYKREVFDKIGFYDDNRFGGDSEYWQRFEKAFPGNNFATVTRPLTDAFFGNTNLTAANPDTSDKRKRYVESYTSRHLTAQQSGQWFWDFDIENHLGLYGDYKVCGVATVPGREEALKDTIISMIDQVDKIIVYQNGYKQNLNFDCKGKVEVISSFDTRIDMGDAGKFFKVDEYQNCYYFSIDDDLIYPKDYVEKMIGVLKRYKNRVVASCHGRIMKPGAKSYYNDIEENFRCLDKVAEEKYIHFGGTGVMAFHTKHVKFNFDDCKAPNMADIWMGLFARKHDIPIVIVPHSEGWINHSTKFDENQTIFRQYKSNHGIQDRLLQQFDTKYIYQLKKSQSKKIHVAFISCSYKRPDISEIFKKNLLNLQRFFNDDCVFTNIMVDSENTNYEVFANHPDFMYMDHDNFPISDKWQATLKPLQNGIFDYVFIIGSDNTIDESIFEQYLIQMRKGVDIIGITDMYIYDLIDKEMYYWPGYPKKHKRHGETIGLGRCFSKRVLQQMNYQLWDSGLNKGLDSNMRKNMEKVLDDSFTKYEFSSKPFGVACDIKGGFNISELEDFLPLCLKADMTTKSTYEKKLV